MNPTHTHSPPVKITAAEHRKLLNEVRDEIVAEVKRGIGGLEEAIILPLTVAATMLGMRSSKTVRSYLPTVETSPGKYGVALAAVRQHIANNTHAPKP